jgi:hypothetical protein
MVVVKTKLLLQMGPGRYSPDLVAFMLFKYLPSEDASFILVGWNYTQTGK